MSNQSLQDYRRREQIMYSYVPPPSTVAQYQSTSHLNPPDRLIPSIAQSNNHQAPRSAMRHHLPTNPSQAMGMYPSVSSHMSQPPQYHYAPPLTTHQGSLVYAPVTYPISNSHSSGPCNTAQATPQTWLPSRQPSDPKSLRSYQDPRHAQLSGGQGYYIVSQPVPSPSTERSASQTASGRSSRVSSSSTSSRDADCQGLRALADAPDNNTGHPGYAIKVLAEFAIKGSSTGRMSLNDIYLAVEERYPVFRTEEMANWRHSARHDISMDPRFVRIARGPDEPGKGGFWTFDPSVPRKPPTPRPRAKKIPSPNAPETPSAPGPRRRVRMGTSRETSPFIYHGIRQLDGTSS